MKCIILAAGRGTRMGDLTLNTPKPMLKINNKPKLAWTIDGLPDSINEVVIIVGYLKGQIIDFFGEFYNGKKIIYKEQINLDGTAGALKSTEGLIEENEKFLVIMGDDFYHKNDLEKLLENDYSALAFEEERDAFKFGVFTVDENDYLLKTVEKPNGVKKGLVSTNAFVLKKDYFKTKMFLGNKGEYWLPNTIIRMIDEKKIKVKVVKTKKWFPVGDKMALKKAENILKFFI